MGKIQEFHVAVKNNDERKVAHIILKNKKKVSQILESTDLDGKLALHLAAENGNMKIVSLLLSYNAPVNAKDKRGWTALLGAANGFHLEICSLLLQSGADPGVATSSGNTCLHYLARRVHTSNKYEQLLEEFLDKGAKTDAANNQGEIPLHKAALSGNLKFLKFLLAHNANIDASTIFGETPLHFAARGGKVEMLKELIAGGANPTSLGKFGTPADVAMSMNQQECLDLLNDAMGKADANNNQNKLLDILRHPELCTIFFGFLEKSFSHENVAFWIEIETFRQLFETDAQEAKEKGKKIYDKFLKPRADYEINVDSVIKEAVATAIEKDITANIFDEAQSFIVNLMAYDSYPKFKRSDIYKQYNTGKLVTPKQKGELWDIVGAYFKTKRSQDMLLRNSSNLSRQERAQSSVTNANSRITEGVPKIIRSQSTLVPRNQRVVSSSASLGASFGSAISQIDQQMVDETSAELEAAIDLVIQSREAAICCNFDNLNIGNASKLELSSLVKCLQSKPNIIEAKFSNNNLDDTSCQAILDALETTNINSIDLSDNDISNINIIKNFIEKSKTVQRIYLARNREISAKDEAFVWEKLRKNIETTNDQTNGDVNNEDDDYPLDRPLSSKERLELIQSLKLIVHSTTTDDGSISIAGEPKINSRNVWPMRQVSSNCYECQVDGFQAMFIVVDVTAMTKDARLSFQRGINKLVALPCHSNIMRYLFCKSSLTTFFVFTTSFPLSLHKFMKQNSKLSIDQVILVCSAILKALAFLHTHKMSHNHLKTNMVFVRLQSSSIISHAVVGGAHTQFIEAPKFFDEARAIDTLQFGGLLYELLTQKEAPYLLSKESLPAVGEETKEQLTREDSRSSALLELYQSCSNPIPSRPTASSLLASFSAL